MSSDNAMASVTDATLCKRCGIQTPAKHGLCISCFFSSNIYQEPEPRCLTPGCEYKPLPRIGYCPTCAGRRDRVAVGLENPKDIIGSNKIPLHLWPETASVLGSLALLDGALKYGRSNWRAVGIRASIYYDAARRHLNAWFEGEDLDQESGLPHLAHALACVAIIVDAQAAGKMDDDRSLPGNYIEQVKALTGQVSRLKRAQAGIRPPRHYTIKDKNPS